MSTVLFDNTNTDGVNTGVAAPTVFGLAEPTFLTRVYLYYYNNGQGADPNMVVYLRQIAEGPIGRPPNAATPDVWFGPFPTVLSPGQFAPNANVEIFPDIAVPAGRYEAVPTDLSRWSFNARSGGQGFLRVEGTVIPTLPTPPSNQYERANWAVGANQTETIVWFQPVGVSATYLAIYRITNSESSTRVQVTIDHGSFPLDPGRSADVSSQKITITSMGLAAWGTFQDLCCSIAVAQTPARPTPAPPPPPPPPPSPPPPPPDNRNG